MNETLESFCSTDFTNGTLVEYKRGFEVELIRYNIENIMIKGKTLEVNSPAGRVMFTANYKSNLIKKEDGIFYLYIPYVGKFTMAPEGVEIPLRSYEL